MFRLFRLYFYQFFIFFTKRSRSIRRENLKGAACRSVTDFRILISSSIWVVVTIWMGRGNNKFTALNLNDIYGKKEPKPKPPIATTNGNTSGNHPPGYMLVLTRQKQPSLSPKTTKTKPFQWDPSPPPRPCKRRELIIHGQSNQLMFVRRIMRMRRRTQKSMCMEKQNPKVKH